LPLSLNDLSKLNDISNVKEDSIDDNISDIVDKIIEQKEKMKIYNMISSKENKCIQDHKIKGINEQIDFQVDKILNDKEQELNYNKYNELYNLSKETYN
jgi:K+/H+ antiporter YhaU regulatory subunit KhtT